MPSHVLTQQVTTNRTICTYWLPDMESAMDVPMIGTAMNHRRDGRWPLTIGGLASVVLGIVLAAGPLIGAVVLTWWLGIYALIFGAALVAFGLKLRQIAAG